MIAIKKCDSHTWRQPRRFRPRRAKTSDGGQAMAGGAQYACSTAANHGRGLPQPSSDDSAARVQALSENSSNLKDKNTFRPRVRKHSIFLPEIQISKTIVCNRRFAISRACFFRHLDKNFTNRRRLSVTS